MSECVTVGVSRTMTVAAGVFAPGHLGELTQVVPFELVDAVLAETGRRERRLRALPSRVGVYLLLALGLFEEIGVRLVWEKLVAGLGGLAVPSVSEKALRDLRRRIGPAPLEALFGVLAGPVAQPRTPGVFYRRWRTVAFDGCSSVRVPDHERNRRWLGKIQQRLGMSGYPTVMLMTLAETGTRALLGAVFGPAWPGERAYAMRLVHLLGPDMLVLADRGFDGDEFLKAVTATRAQALVRCRAVRRLPVLTVLPDGSYLTHLAGMTLRVIDARIQVTGADGIRTGSEYRLITTLTDHRADPAKTLIALYHQRWEIESAYYALRHTLLHGRVLRSKDPVGVQQEIWALLAIYQALRHAMVAAVETRPGTDPDRASFTIAVQAARDTITTATGITPTHSPCGHGIDLTGHIGQAILARLLPPRRARFSARKVKCSVSRYSAYARHTKDDRPPTSTTITTLAITIHTPNPDRKQTAPSRPPRQTRPHTTQPRWDLASAIMASAPNQPWRARDIARTLGLRGEPALNSFCVQMSSWARQGRITRTGPGTYTLNPHQP